MLTSKWSVSNVNKNSRFFKYKIHRWKHCFGQTTRFSESQQKKENLPKSDDCGLLSRQKIEWNKKGEIRD